MPLSEPRTSQDKSLIEFCEPFFLAVGEVTRSPDLHDTDGRAVRDRLIGKLDELRRAAKEESNRLASGFTRILPVLAYFADDVINSSTLPFSEQWKDDMLLASESWIGGVANGKERFFLELEGALREGRTAEERLAIFHSCLGLGFGGIWRDNQNKLREYAEQVLHQLETVKDKMCAEAEDRIQPDVLCTPIAEKLWAIGLICAALLLALLVSYVSIHLLTREEISKVLGTIIKAN